MKNNYTIINTKLINSLKSFLNDRDIELNSDFDISTNFIEEFNLDSLDLVELFIAIEDDLKISIPNNVQNIKLINNIQSLTKYILDNNLLEDKINEI